MRISDWSSDVCSSDLYLDDIERIGEAAQKIRDHVGSHLCLTVILERDELALRLRARRAGADALVVAPASVEDILRVLRSVAVPPAGEPYRVLIVEDDRAQGVFAESVLRNTGMDARVVEDPLAVLDTLHTRSEEHTSELQSLMRIS